MIALIPLRCRGAMSQADQWQMAMQLKGAAVATASYNAVAWPTSWCSLW